MLSNPTPSAAIRAAAETDDFDTLRKAVHEYGEAMFDLGNHRDEDGKAAGVRISGAATSRRAEVDRLLAALRGTLEKAAAENSRLLCAFNELKAIHEQYRAAIDPLCKQNAQLKENVAAAAAREELAAERESCPHCGGEMYKPEDGDESECAWCSVKTAEKVIDLMVALKQSLSGEPVTGIPESPSNRT